MWEYYSYHHISFKIAHSFIRYYVFKYYIVTFTHRFYHIFIVKYTYIIFFYIKYIKLFKHLIIYNSKI